MLNDIKLGCLDFWKNKLLALFYMIFFTCIMFTFVSSSNSMIRKLKDKPIVNNNKLAMFDVSLIGLEPENPKQLLDTLSFFYHEDGFSVSVTSLSVDQTQKVSTYIIFGDVSKEFPFFDSKEMVSVYSGRNKKSITNVRFHNVDYKVQMQLQENYSFEPFPLIVEGTDNYLFIVIKEPNLSDWISSDNHDVIFELLMNTRISKENTQRIQEFIDATNSDFVVVREHKSSTNSMKSEVVFVRFIVYPFLLLLLLSCFGCTSIILDGVIKKRTKEFTIHMLHGARLKNILIRLLTFFVIIMGGAIGFGVLIHMIDPRVIGMYITMSTIIIFVFALIIIVKLRRKNLGNNLRNEDNL